MRENKPQREYLADLRKRLSSADGITQYQAFLEAQELPTEQLLRLVSTQPRRLHKRLRIETWALIGCLSMPLMVILSKIVFGVENANFVWWFSGVLACMLLPMSALVGHPEDVRLCRRLSRLVQPQQDTRFVGPALLLYHNIDADTRSNARNALLRLLPKLCLEETRQWDIAQRQSLFGILRTPWKDVEMTLCALQTIEQAIEVDMLYDREEMRLLLFLSAGPDCRPARLSSPQRALHEEAYAFKAGSSASEDERIEQLQREAERRGRELDQVIEQKLREIEESQRMVEQERRELDPYAYVLPRSDKQVWFAKSSAGESHKERFDNKNDRAQEVREAAKRCVKALLARTQERQHTDTLLRAVVMTTNGEQTLLRPAADINKDTLSGQLLRSTQGPE